jgi:hypothetical protein
MEEPVKDDFDEKEANDRKQLVRICSYLSQVKYHEDRNQDAEALYYIDMFNAALETYLHPEAESTILDLGGK